MANEVIVEMAENVKWKASCNIGTLSFSGWKKGEGQLIWKKPEEIRCFYSSHYVNFKPSADIKMVAGLLMKIMREDIDRDDIEITVQKEG